MPEFTALPMSDWRVNTIWFAVLLIGTLLTLAADDSAWRRGPLLLASLFLSWCAIAADDVVYLMLAGSAATWIGLGAMAQQQRPDGEAGPPFTRWCGWMCLSDVAAVSGLAFLRQRVPSTQLSLWRQTDLLESFHAQEPALLTVIGLLLFASIGIRLGLYPALGWIKGATTVSLPATVWTLCCLFPLAHLTWMRLLPMFTVSADLRTLGSGVAALSCILLCLMGLMTSHRERIPGYLAVAWSAVALFVGFSSPDQTFWFARSLATYGLVAIGLHVLTRERFAGNLAWAGHCAAAVLLLLALSLAGLPLALLVLFSAIPLWRWNRRNSSTGACHVTTGQRLADSELYLDTMFDWALAWPLWCLLLVVSYISDTLLLAWPSELKASWGEATQTTLNDLDQSPAGTLELELFLGTLCILGLAIWAGLS